MKKGKGVINMKKNLITFRKPKSPISEAYRMLRTNLNYIDIEKDDKVIVITSANMAEGKTSTLCNLAITIADAGKKVLLVDCDLRKPKVHRYFDIKNEEGLVNVVVEGIFVESIIREIEDVPNLKIITSGPVPPNPSEILSSNSMNNLISKLKLEYDVILFDAPPVCSVTDAAQLSNIADGVILVVASGSTNVGSAKLAKKLLQNVGANIIGVVLTKVEKTRNGSYFYYNEDYYGEGKKKKNRKNKKMKNKLQPSN